MYKVTQLVHLAAGADEPTTATLIGDLRAAAHDVCARRFLVEKTLPGSRNGGDVLVHLQFDDEHGWASGRDSFAAIENSPAVAHLDGVEYHGGQSGAAHSRGTVYRTLLLRVQPGTPAASVEAFESDLVSMPRYIGSIRAWQLSRVAHPIGAAPWTHVWEQEFTDLNGLLGPYMMHPIHWGLVDRWFDPECPECIVREQVCHSFCDCNTAVLG